MLRFVKQVLISAMIFSSYNLSSVNPLKCISMTGNNNINSNKLLFYLYSIRISKCSGIYNNINDPFAKLYVPDVVKGINFKVFNLMSKTNEKRHQIA